MSTIYFSHLQGPHEISKRLLFITVSFTRGQGAHIALNPPHNLLRTVLMMLQWS